jgi:hypothetical protein
MTVRRSVGGSFATLARIAGSDCWMKASGRESGSMFLHGVFEQFLIQNYSMGMDPGVAYSVFAHPAASQVESEVMGLQRYVITMRSELEC